MIKNLTKKNILSERTYYALSLWDRTRGMIRRQFQDFDAMVFFDCSAIHTMFMGMNLDVVFMDRGNRVVKTVSALPPWRPFVFAPRAYAVIEMPEGTLERSGIMPDDELELDYRESSGVVTSGCNVMEQRNI